MREYFVYILASGRDGVSYVGVTNDLIRRMAEHRMNSEKSFTSDYNVKKLVYFESTNDIRIALQREKRLKKWNRQWKVELIEKTNPYWKDLLPADED
ncbi:GIY-YIG nuclease family protein [Patescibacteria group bacterium]|nr:GIY-YIG nuclease family protein [Patescibacteria group bacterium]